MEGEKPQLMAVIADHIYSPRLAEHYGEIYEPLSDEQAAALNKLLWQVYRRETRVYEFEKKAKELKLPKFNEEVWPGILRYDLIPMADYLGFRIQDYLNQLRPEDLKNFKVIDLEDWIKKINDEMRLGFNTVDQKKVFNILSQYLRGLKNDEETAQLVSNPQNLGGIGLNQDIAKNLVEKFKTALGDAAAADQFITEQKIDLAFVEKLRAKKEEESFFKSHRQPVAAAASDQQSAAGGQPLKNNFLMADSRKPTTSLSAQEVKKEKAAAAAVAEARVVAVPAIEKYDTEAEKVIAAAGIKIAPELARRLKIVVISRLKDIRKPVELKERLLSKPEEGGVGLKAEEAERIIKLAEAGRTKFFSNQPSATSSQPIGKSFHIADSRTPVADSRTPVADSRTPVADSRHQPSTLDVVPTAPQAIKIVPQPAASHQLSAISYELPATSNQRPAPTIAIPQTPSGKAKVEDVSYMPRLMGPLEELKEMTLLDFHRLSPKVKVSIDKISAKIELLGQEGYERKMKGVQVWQRSPLNQLYTSILSESLRRGVSVAQVIEERQKNKQETLTLEEFKAILGLNKSLRA